MAHVQPCSIPSRPPYEVRTRSETTKVKAAQPPTPRGLTFVVRSIYPDLNSGRAALRGPRPRAARLGVRRVTRRSCAASLFTQSAFGVSEEPIKEDT